MGKYVICASSADTGQIFGYVNKNCSIQKKPSLFSNEETIQNKIEGASYRYGGLIFTYMPLNPQIREIDYWVIRNFYGFLDESFEEVGDSIHLAKKYNDFSDVYGYVYEVPYWGIVPVYK